MLSNLKNRQKNYGICRKDLILFHWKQKMNALFGELRFNIIVWIVITAYWITVIWNLIAVVPESATKDNDIFKFNKWSYSFRLFSSLLFFLFGISQFQYPILVLLTVIEMIIIISVYIYLLASKAQSLKRRKKNLKHLEKKMNDEIKWKLR